MADCIFCRIVEGSIPSAKVFEDDDVLAFMDINPLSHGHVLVIPRRHYDRLTDMPPEDMAAVGRQLPLVAQAVMRATKAEGFNVYQTNGACAGQQVGHVHFHVIPRSTGDGLGFRWNPGKYAGQEMEKYRALIAQYLTEMTK